MSRLSKFMHGYALVFAAVLAVGETLVIFKTNKYWPLSLDDYLAVLTLAGLALASKKSPRFLALTPSVWAFVAGNLYAMLFTRLDPVHGSGERIGLLVVALSAAVAGFIGAVRVWHSNNTNNN
ncbi:hypothetical protein [Parendozoicomonas sp. Alg238-R29]|uniref:hypothetical protein n=1 Tax=Parendozoicomonas sp. Alg238-R29 TaxID=2993446 RepID=UPI00248F3235|nr:hypothetical protein [Parendozoicomonas sp. Alg238-R29]